MAIGTTGAVTTSSAGIGTTGAVTTSSVVTGTTGAVTSNPLAPLPLVQPVQGKATMDKAGVAHLPQALPLPVVRYGQTTLSHVDFYAAREYD